MKAPRFGKESPPFFLLVSLLVLSCSPIRTATPARSEEAAIKTAGGGTGEAFILGVDANYALSLRAEGLTWRAGGEEVDLLRRFAEQGVNALRVRIWTGKEGPGGLDYAGRTALWGRENGLKLLPVFFLSEGWADLLKQPAPAEWENLSLANRAEAVRVYSRKTARYFRELGIETDLYQVGNEIDYGICGVFAGEGTDRDNPDWLAGGTWKAAARIVRAAQSGIGEVDPGARFVVHLARWWDPGFCVRFYRTMIGEGVRIDYLGLSYFPTSGLGGDNTLNGLEKILDELAAAIGKPVLILEIAYPDAPRFPGQFADWNHPVPGYPLTPEGQAEWLKDFLKTCRDNVSIAGAFYWSPEWYNSGMWSAFSLFSPVGEAKPALGALTLP